MCQPLKIHRSPGSQDYPGDYSRPGGGPLSVSTSKHLGIGKVHLFNVPIELIIYHSETHMEHITYECKFCGLSLLLCAWTYV